MVAAPAEPEVVARATAPVKAVWIGEDGRVAFDCDDDDLQLIASMELATSELGVDGGEAADHAKRGVEASELVDHVREERGVGAQRGELIRIAEQGEQGVADRKGGRRLADGGDEDDERHEVVAAEGAGVAIGAERREQRVTVDVERFDQLSDFGASVCEIDIRSVGQGRWAELTRGHEELSQAYQEGGLAADLHVAGRERVDPEELEGNAER